ncbi:GcrA family cell cycle regulator [Formicincola oecophyllae]|nr:GcrA family cell cycle regulator [Formicincola oecophyllae]
MDWTEDMIAKLRNLWVQNLSTADIGRQLGVTKNAVVGKVHRLGLPPRPSPIKGPAPSRSSVAAKAAAVSKPSAPKASNVTNKASPSADAAPEKTKAKKTKSITPARKTPSKTTSKTTSKAAKAVKSTDGAKKVSAKTTKAPSKARVRKTTKAASPGPAVKKLQKRQPVRPLRSAFQCQWPFGDPGTVEFHFCGRTVITGKPYCVEHVAIAYVKLRERRD